MERSGTQRPAGEQEPVTRAIPIQPPAEAGTRIASLNQITWLMTSHGLKGGTFHLIARELHRLLSSYFIAVGILRPGAGHFDMIYGDRAGEGGKGQTDYVFDRHASAYGWACTHRAILLMSDIRREQRFPEHTNMVDSGVRSRIVAPLVSGDEVLGVLGLSSREVGAFSQEDVDLVAVVADAMALGMRNRVLLERTARLELLERTEQMRSLLLSSVSHELRTPLGLIKGYLAVLAQDWHGLPDATRHEFLAIALDETDRLTALVENMLDMSGLHSGNLVIRTQPVPPAQVIHDTLRRLQPLVAAHPLDVRLAAGLPVVQADPARISQVLTNLIENAVRHTPAQTRIALAATPHADGVAITVTDLGPGIPPEHLSQVFTPFARLESHRPDGDSRRAGLGLGLAICKGIVEAHGGRIWVESTPARGSTFWFTLPPCPS